MIPESYLSHALGEQRANHRYIARIPVGRHNRYFYSMDELRAFRNGGSRKSLGDRIDAAKASAIRNSGNVSKVVANRNQKVASGSKKGSDGSSIYRDYIKTMTDPKARKQQLQIERDRNRRMADQGVIGEIKRDYNGIVDDIKTTKDRAVSSVKRDYEGMKKDVDKVKKTISDTKNDLSKSIKRPTDSGVEKNSAMKKQADAMKKANRAMNIQTNYKGGYNIKPLTNLDVISTTAAKGAANVANRVSAQAATKTKEHMAEAKKQVDEGVKRSENYWSKKKDAEKDVTDAYDEVRKLAKSTADKGKDFINGVFDKAKAKAKDTADDVVDAVKSKGKEASSSASKKFEELGRQTRSNIEKSTKEAAEKSSQKLKATKADVEAGYQKISAAARKYGDEISDWPKAAQKEYYEWLSKYHELTGK